ncbi:hypothetical protein KAR91_25660 [Candidatus Pacearchaeota archaeon]|nr:hypothetical protein [Candidatus Pacearchaeota archaeon]
MFLDDKLLQIARNCDQTEEGIIESLNQMLQASFDNYFKIIGINKDDKSIVAGLKRVNNTWKRVVDKLDIENIHFVHRNGFERFIKYKQPKLSHIFN